MLLTDIWRWHISACTE